MTIFLTLALAGLVLCCLVIIIFQRWGGIKATRRRAPDGRRFLSALPWITFILFALSVGGLLYSVAPETLPPQLAVALGLFIVATTLQLMDIQGKTDSAARIYLDELANTQKYIKKTVRSSQNFYDEGNSLIAQGELDSRFSRAIAVKNVFVPFPSLKDAPYPLDSEVRFRAFRSFFESSRAHSLSEIIPSELFFSKSGQEYYRKMLKLVRECGERDDPATMAPKEYSVLILNRTFPVINFIIFYYKDSSKEVFFGWGGFGGNAPTKVYSSTDTNAVQLFEDYHATLARESGRLEDGSSLAARLNRYLGFWVDVAVQIDETGKRKLSNCAVLRFILDSSGRLSIRGTSYDIVSGDLKPDLHAVFRSTSCEIKDTKIFVSHDTLKDLENLESRSSGKTTYDFKFYATLKHFRGTVTSFARARTEGRFLETIGNKVEDPLLIEKLEAAWGKPEAVFAVIEPQAKALIQFAMTQFSRGRWDRGEALPSGPAEAEPDGAHLNGAQGGASHISDDTPHP